jgi:hypothetical protein
LEREVEQWKTKYEVAQAYIDLTRKQEAAMRRDQKKRKGQRRSSSGKLLARREFPRLAAVGDSAGDGDRGGEPAPVDQAEGDAEE